MVTELIEIIPEELAGCRLDQALAKLCPDYSRSVLKQWIVSGGVLVDDQQKKPKDKMHGGEVLKIQVQEQAEKGRAEAEDIPLNIHYQDDHLIIINKPAGLVMHPGAGNWTGTLMNALLHHFPELKTLSRAGIVHRLDQDTTGLLVVARTQQAFYQLTKALEKREISREYEAVIRGGMIAGGSVDEPIGRHPIDRKKMAVRIGGRVATTHYRLIQRFAHYTHIHLKLETGRTHQIRVHMAHLRHPVVGDPVYSGRMNIPAKMPVELLDFLRSFKRQALHAARLSLSHPDTGEWMSWSADVPEDFSQLLTLLARHDKAE